MTSAMEISKDPKLTPSSVYGADFKEEINILNQNFLQSIQNELKTSPEACLAPLVMDYLLYVYPLIKNPAAIPKDVKAAEDFVEVAKFFADIKDRMTNGETKKLSSDGSINGPVKSELFKSVAAPIVSSETDNKKQTPNKPGPGFFGFLDNNHKIEAGSNDQPGLGSSRSEPAAPTSSIAGPSSMSSSKPFTFGLNPISTSSSIPSSSAEPAFSSVAQKPSTSATITPASPSMFSFGTGMTSVTKFVPPVPSTSAFPSSSSGITTSLFGGGLGGSGFGQSSFGTGLMGTGISSGSDAAKGNVNGTAGENKDESDDETPPKPEFVPVVESDSLFTQRIKLYEMQGKAYKDLGIGNLFIKELDGPKYQLIVRADNSLGTILVNVVLNASSAIRQNKATNILATLPSSDGKPTTYLFRVKEESVGNELYNLLEKYKNS